MSITLLRFYLYLAVLPLAFLTIALLLIRAQPHDDSDLRQLFLADSCTEPCFMGIRPGVTTMEEARKILEASGWADHVILNSGINLTATQRFISISWDWNDSRSPLLATRSSAYMLSFQQDTHAIVDSIYIATTVPMGSLRLLLQPPQRYRFGMLFPTGSLTAKVLARVSAIYDRFEASANLICPLKISSMWNLQSNLYFYSQAPANEDIRLWDNRTISHNLKSACRR